VRTDLNPFWPHTLAAYLTRLGEIGPPISGVPRRTFFQVTLAYLKRYGLCYVAGQQRPFLKTVPLALLLFTLVDNLDASLKDNCRSVSVILEVILRALAEKVMTKCQLDVYVGSAQSYGGAWRRRDLTRFPHDIVVVQDCSPSSPYYGTNMAYTNRIDFLHETLDEGIDRWCRHLLRVADKIGERDTWAL